MYKLPKFFTSHCIHTSSSVSLHLFPLEVKFLSHPWRLVLFHRVLFWWVPFLTKISKGPACSVLSFWIPAATFTIFLSHPKENETPVESQTSLVACPSTSCVSEPSWDQRADSCLDLLKNTSRSVLFCLAWVTYFGRMRTECRVFLTDTAHCALSLSHMSRLTLLF